MSKHFLILSNNTIEVNFMEAIAKEDFAFEEVKPPHNLESESNAGKVAAQLQERAVKLIQRRR